METIYTDSFLRIGDEVIMKMDEDRRGWSGDNRVPDGTKGVVVGFKEYFTSVDIDDGSGIKPGIYRGNGAAFVKWENGFSGYESYCLQLPKELVEVRQNDMKYRNTFAEKVFFSELPEFQYMVGNRVTISWCGRYENGTLTHINYVDFIENKKCTDGSPMPIFRINLDTGGTVTICEDQIKTLLEHGNYWAWKNDKSALKFKDLKEEVSFYSSLGMTKQLICPSSQDYQWPIDELVEAIKNGEADLIKMSGGMFGSAHFPTAYKLDESLSDLAKRCREEIIKGFSDKKN